jgi:UDP-glucose 4-epimerase
MRKNDVKKIAFTSTSTVYGEAETIPTPEDASLQPISLYGASKLGCEALLLAYSHTFSFQSWIFRFANVIGRRGTHGVLVDFIKKLRKNPSKLEILGDGKQKKSYMLVEDCIDAMLFAVEKTSGGVFNLGSKDWIEVNEIAEIVCDELKLKNVRFHYTGGKRGWVGDVPRMRLSIDKMEKLGWRPRFSSRESIRIAVRILANDLQEGKIYR